MNESIAFDYLSSGLLDHKSETFDKQIKQLRGGEMAIVKFEGTKSDFSIPSPQSNSSSVKMTINKWYNLETSRWEGNGCDATRKFRKLFKDSIRFRLRADVPVGSCLSGGLDSSAIVCQVADLLKENGNHKGQKTVTASYKIGKYDEWEYASKVIKRTGAQSFRVWPTHQKLVDDLDRLLWHMDEPFGSTSQFSQWSVFEGAAKAGLKVMLDGQGADELLAGYGGNDVPLYAGLLKKRQYSGSI